jgi:glucose-6-phosphate isomerase
LTAELEPFTTLLDLEGGAVEPERKVTQRTLGDLDGLFLDPVPAERAEELAYTVSEIPAPVSASNLLSSVTVLRPGLVGREFHMTKGHYHEVRDRAEIYVTLRGEGLLVMGTEDGRHQVDPMGRGTVNYVAGGWAHRSVNIGDEPLVFYAVYVADAGYDYGTIEEEGFPVVVVTGDGGPVVVPNPRYRP